MELDHNSASNTELPPLLQDNASKVTSSIIAKERKKDKRLLNLILHNIIESNAEDPQERKLTLSSHMLELKQIFSML